MANEATKKQQTQDQGRQTDNQEKRPGTQDPQSESEQRRNNPAGGHQPESQPMGHQSGHQTGNQNRESGQQSGRPQQSNQPNQPPSGRTNQTGQSEQAPRSGGTGSADPQFQKDRNKPLTDDWGKDDKH